MEKLDQLRQELEKYKILIKRDYSEVNNMRENSAPTSIVESKIISMSELLLQSIKNIREYRLVSEKLKIDDGRIFEQNMNYYINYIDSIIDLKSNIEIALNSIFEDESLKKYKSSKVKNV